MIFYALIFLIFILIGVFLSKCVKQYRNWSSIIDKIPGPRGVPIFGIALKFLVKKEDVVKVGLELAEPFVGKYPILKVWLGPFPVVIILRADAAKVLLNNNKNIEKAIFYGYLRSWIGEGLITSSGTKWHQRRKLITPSFHFRILENFLPVMNEQSEILVQVLEKKCAEKPSDIFDVYPYLTRCTLDIICATAMGQHVDAQINTNSDYVNAVINVGQTVSKRILQPWLASDAIFNWSPLGTRFRRSLNVIHNFTNNVIKNNREKFNQNKENYNLAEDNVGCKRRVALLDLMLENSMLSNNNAGPAFTDDDIREEVDTFMFAGHDTTSVALAWALYFIGQYPEIQQKLVEELNTICDEENQHISTSDLHDLKYMECVFKETIRYIPPIPLYGRTLSEDLDICGYLVPAGVTVISNPHLIHRDPTYYPDPETFDPDRFLPQNCQDRDPFAYVPFSAGPRNCIGQKFAMMEFKVILSWILRKFVVKSVEEADLMSNVSMELVCRPLRGIQIQLEKRNRK